MARVKISPLLADISGSIGMCTFQRSLGGMSLRQKPVNSPVLSESQIYSNIYMASTIKAWRDLTSAQRDNWDKFVLYNPFRTLHVKNRTLSGYALFVRYNTYRLHTGFSILSVPIFQSTLDTTVVFDFAQGGSGLRLNTVYDFDPSERWFLLKMSAPVNDSVNNISSKMRLIYCTQGVSHLFYIGAAYSAALGFTPSSGDFVFYSLIVFSTVTPLIYYYLAIKHEIGSY